MRACDISFTTTAMCRPEILEETLSSFDKNLLDVSLKQFKIYINIDPAPAPSLQNDVLEVAKNYFGHVIANRTKKCNFAKALHWAWRSVDTPYIFNLEDDWELLKPIYLQDVYKLLSKKIHHIVLNIRASHKYGVLSPSLIKTKFVLPFLKSYSFTQNPETQYKAYQRRFNRSYKKSYPWDFNGDTSVFVKDIGREWRTKRNILKKRPGDESTFIRWA